VAIVGSGPAGLAAASLLRRYGHGVTIYEELETSGGTAWYGIPDYHLPKDVLEYEISRIKGEGIEIITSTKVGKEVTLTQLLSEKNDAVLITTGPKDVIKLHTPGIDLKGVFDGYGFLEDVYVNGVESYLKDPKYDLGKDILVIGGGDTALDDARTAKRLSQGNVTLVYRRTENEMPADPIMAEEAKEEGVEFKFLTDPKEYRGDGGKLTSCLMNTMKLGEPDETGRRKPEPVPGKEFTMRCSAVLMAVGRGPNSFLQKKAGIKTGKKNSIAVDDHYRTSMAGVFAAGDVTTGETLVVKAMGSGRDAAQRVHEYLVGIDDREHTSLYEHYYVQRSFGKMISGNEDKERGELPS
jgi:NADPH-dependent glutamate synthase beta subunit-like oxidoreductase